MNIAICDDEILFTRELSSLLTHWAEKNDFSLTLYPYSNGDDLLTALRTIPVDLIFLDIIMPLLNGIDTAREIRSMGLLEYTCEKGVACRVDSVHFFVRTVIETYNSESDEIARLLL